MKLPSLFQLATAATLLTATTLGAASLAACLRTESYVYTAQRYDPGADCVESSTPVELVDGPGVGTLCPAMCLTVGSDLYVSTMCPPLPVIAMATAEGEGDCTAALAALAQGASCDDGTDDGSEEDAAGDDDAGEDEAGEDASSPAEDAGSDAKDSGVQAPDGGDAG
jgi:hypothetical protein